MKVENILEVEVEIKRFLKRLKELKKENPDRFKSNSDKHWFYPSKEVSALKRSSMDLTRSLSKLRIDY